MDAHGMPVRLILTEGTVADCTQALPLTEGLLAEYLLADRSLPRTGYGGYGTNSLVAGAIAKGVEPVIPPSSHRKELRDYYRHWYRLRHLVENTFLNFKPWRAVATRYAKKTASFRAICQIRALVIWPKSFDDAL